MVARTLVARLTHLLGQFGIGHHLVDGRGHVGNELVGVGGGSRTVVQLVDRHQITGFPVDHDFRNASRRRGDHR